MDIQDLKSRLTLANGLRQTALGLEPNDRVWADPVDDDRALVAVLSFRFADGAEVICLNVYGDGAFTVSNRSNVSGVLTGTSIQQLRAYARALHLIETYGLEPA